MAKGCDYSWGRPNLGGLKQAGMTFVCRYVSPDTTGKNLTANEANAIRANGMNIVTNWEWEKTAALNGRAQGVSDAARAINMHNDIGGPSQIGIYFSIDFDAQDNEMHQVAAYIDGCTATIGYDRVGVYGGKRVIDNMAATNRCKYFWQTYAWSYGQWSGAANLRQVQNSVVVAGGEVDIDESMTVDYGGWFGGAEAGPPEVPNTNLFDFSLPLWQIGDQFSAIGGTLFGVADVLNNTR